MRDRVRSLHGHAFRRIRLASECKLGLGWGGIILLVQQANIAGASRRRGKSSRVGDGCGDDALVG